MFKRHSLMLLVLFTLLFGSVAGILRLQNTDLPCQMPHCNTPNTADNMAQKACLLGGCCTMLVGIAYLLWRLQVTVLRWQHPQHSVSFVSHHTLPLLRPPK